MKRYSPAEFLRSLRAAVKSGAGIRAALSTRRARLGVLSGTGTLLLAAALGLSNLVAQRFYLRLDWSQGGRYSLSKVSRRLVRNLPDPVLFRAYISGGLPQPFGAQARYVADLLSEYRAAGRGRVKVELFDPESSDKAMDDARRSGVSPQPITQVGSDMFQVREGFLGLVLFYQDKQEVIPFIKDTSNLEYEITSRLRSLTRTGKKKLGLTFGHGEPSVEMFRRGIGGKAADLFQIETILLSTSAVAGPGADVLFIVNPQRPFTPSELDALDARISSGTPVAFFVGRKAINLQAFSAYPLRTGLEDMLAHYGVRVGEDIVLDAQCQPVTVQFREGGETMTQIVHYPPFILSRPDPKHPTTKSLDVLAFSFAQPLTLSPVRGLTATPLAFSSPYSWVSPGAEFFNPMSIRPPSQTDPKGPFPLAAIVEGSTTSWRDDARVARVRIAVVGTGQFAGDDLPLAPGNADFLSNVAGWLAQEKDFSTIPSRGPVFRPLRRSSALVRAAVKLVGFFFLPAGAALWGLIRWRRRRAQRPLIQKEWEAAARG